MGHQRIAELIGKQRPRNIGVAQRLRRLRHVFGPGQSEFCRRYGFTVSQWSNYEAGWKPSLAAAQQMKDRIDGISLDWIYYGETGGLTVRLARLLEEPPAG